MRIAIDLGFIPCISEKSQESKIHPSTNRHFSAFLHRFFIPRHCIHPCPFPIFLSLPVCLPFEGNNILRSISFCPFLLSLQSKPGTTPEHITAETTLESTAYKPRISLFILSFTSPYPFQLRPIPRCLTHSSVLFQYHPRTCALIV